MRENYTWATDCGPVVGEIKHGKRYINGNVSVEKYDEDMSKLNKKIDDLEEQQNIRANQLAETMNTMMREEAEMRSDIRSLQTTTDKIDRYCTLVKGN